MSADPATGRIDPDVAAEFPELRLWTVMTAARLGPSTPGLKERLRVLSSRFSGARAVQLRADPIPHAFRVFFRHIGLDPDTERTPVEAAVVDRLFHGGFRSQGLLDDALLLAVAETGVAVWALDDATLSGDLGIRPARDGERLGQSEYAHDLVPGRLVVADAARPVAALFGATAPEHVPGKETETLRLYSVQPPGVPTIHVDEAFWLVAEALDSA
jgi:DNA/RNA-binding domain of Phe-tRNA-synthetase-like protein